MINTLINKSSDTNWKSSWIFCADFHISCPAVCENGILSFALPWQPINPSEYPG